MMAFGGHHPYGPPPMHHHGFAPPPHFGGVPFGMGYPANLGQGYSYSPYVQQMPPPMVHQPPQGTYSNRSSQLYSSYNSSLYATPTPRRNSELYSSTGSLTMSSAAVQRAVQQPAMQQSSIVKIKPAGHPPKHPPATRMPAPVQHLHSARSPSPQESPAKKGSSSPVVGVAPSMTSPFQRSPAKGPLSQVTNNISPLTPTGVPSPPRMGSPLVPQQYGLQKRYERYEYSQYGNQNQNITYGASPFSPQLFSSNGASAQFAVPGQEPEEVKEEGGDVAAAGVDHKDWAWEPSCDEGLLTFHDGRKRWYHCTNCQYFNDRLYHSKMHYDRIHVKQGKSMPHKRKYMEPAGSKAGEGVALPPSTLKQPEPTRTRTRRPGDKWLKTSTSDSAASGFRHVSVHEREHIASLELGEAQKQMQLEEQERHPLSDGGAPSPTEISRRAKELGLAEDETTLYCWEPADENVKRGFENGGAVKLFIPVYRFGTEVLPESAHRPTAWRQQNQAQAAAIASSQKENKGLRWWWYNPAPAKSGDEGDDDDTSLSQTPTQHNTPAKGGKQGQKTRGVQLQYAPPKGSGSQIPTMQALPSVALDVKVQHEDSEAEAVNSGIPDDAPLGVMLPRQFPAGCRGGGKSRRPGDPDVKAKRVWRRWDAEEERLLRNAVTKLGTKDWSAIHEEMGKDRSIKQLQDHWNDTKNNRASKS